MRHRPFTDNNAGLYPYSSLQINVPSILSKEIIQWGEDMIRDEEVYDPPYDQLRGREDEIHITLLYGVHTSDPEFFQPILSEERSFEVKLGVISLFTTNDDFDVVKIEASSPTLHYLNQFLRKNVSHTPYYYTYNPHVTIAYVRKNSCNHLEGENYFKDWKWRVNTVVFSSKNGNKTPIRINSVMSAFCS